MHDAPAMQSGCPKRVVFVLKETEPEAWISNGGDFSAYLKPPGVDEVVDRVRTCTAIPAVSVPARPAMMVCPRALAAAHVLARYYSF